MRLGFGSMGTFPGKFRWTLIFDQPPRNLEVTNYASTNCTPSKSSQKSNCSPRNLPKRRKSITSPPLANQRRRWNARMYHVVQEEYTGGLISNHAHGKQHYNVTKKSKVAAVDGALCPPPPWSSVHGSNSPSALVQNPRAPAFVDGHSRTHTKRR